MAELLKIKKPFEDKEAIKNTNRLNADAIITPLIPPSIPPKTLFNPPKIKLLKKELINFAKMRTTKIKGINIIIATTDLIPSTAMGFNELVITLTSTLSELHTDFKSISALSKYTSI